MKHTIKILLLGLFSMLFMFANAQENANMTLKQQRKTEKARLKKEKEAKEAANWIIYQKMAQDSKFVIEITRIYNKPVSQRLNFFYVNGDKFTLQFETNAYWSENGLGGSTIKGNISNYKYAPPKSKNKPIYISLDITTKFDQKQINVSINIYSDGTSLISFGHGLSPLNGIFIPIEDANINIGPDMRN